MSTVAIILVAIVALIAVLYLIGLRLPRTHRAGSRIALHRPPEDVWAVIRDPAGLLGSWSKMKSAKRTDDGTGPERWEQDIDGWKIPLIIEETIVPRRLVTRIDTTPAAAFGGRWVYELVPTAEGTTITVTEEGYVNPPLFRVMMTVMGVHRSVDAYLGALAAKFGEQSRVEHS